MVDNDVETVVLDRFLDLINATYKGRPKSQTERGLFELGAYDRPTSGSDA